MGATRIGRQTSRDRVVGGRCEERVLVGHFCSEDKDTTQSANDVRRYRELIGLESDALRSPGSLADCRSATKGGNIVPVVHAPGRAFNGKEDGDVLVHGVGDGHTIRDCFSEFGHFVGGTP